MLQNTALCRGYAITTLSQLLFFAPTLMSKSIPRGVLVVRGCCRARGSGLGTQVEGGGIVCSKTGSTALLFSLWYPVYIGVSFVEKDHNR